MVHRLKKKKAFFLRNKGAIHIIKLIHAKGGEAYFVGGCVRNSILNQSRFEDDIDITTSLLPEEVIALCDGKKLKYIPTGLAFGTVTLITHGRGYEVTTMRQDIETDGRHAIVKFTTDYRKDALRRDFTMNAVYCDGEGQIFSPVGGVEDILKKQVRFIGNPERRILEDYLRILRYYRFIAHYGVPEECDSVSIMCASHLKQMIRPSMERNMHELRKLVMLPFAVQSLDIMKKYHILEAFFENKFCNIQELNDIIALQKEFSMYIPAFLRIFILFGTEIIEAQGVFRFSRKETREIKMCINIVDFLEKMPQDIDILIKRYDYENIIYHVAVMLYCIKYNLPPERRKKIKLLLDIPLPDFSVTGYDILAQGIKGKQVGQVLYFKRLEFLKKFIQENYFYLDIV